MDLFRELLPSLLETKKSIMTDENEHEYVPFVVNKALASHLDCVLYCNEMNLYHQLDKRLQHDFYLHALIKKKRPYQKWYKESKSNDIMTIAEYYGMSYNKANDVLGLISDDDMKHMREVLDKGGRK